LVLAKRPSCRSRTVFLPRAKRRPLEGTKYVFDFDEQQRNGGLADAERHQQEYGPDPERNFDW
jgi:hypothetical protein